MDTIARLLRPRDEIGAARVLAVALVLAMVATVGWEVVGWQQGRPGSDAGSVASSLVALAIVGLLAAVLVRVPHRVPTLAWPVVAVVQPLATAATVVAAHDASAGAQFGLVYAVVFAASQFGGVFAWSVTALAVSADAWIVFSVLDPGPAASDLLVVACALPMITLVLQLTNAHQDRLRARLDELAGADSLTGLTVRRRLVEAGTRALAAGRPTGLLVVDVDRFKELNDTHGHPVGDLVLVQIADLLRASAGDDDLAARLGGDELALLVRGDHDAVRRRALDLRDAVRGHHWRRPGLAPTVSVGWVTAHPGWGFGELYEAADRALYEAKAHGRDRVVGAPGTVGGAGHP
ncbi:diguanylate cyclase [uncultured Cellulomonas sp.]|uniref:GGDEF domain-containing protein n=1 Tax=uncultured Cellulomonas sp. TaxID=189682 RepID=UPI0026254082|nr:GGDEF domain-containing protein [uncultured Cellulomonas sp.]